MNLSLKISLSISFLLYDVFEQHVLDSAFSDIPHLTTVDEDVLGSFHSYSYLILLGVNVEKTNDNIVPDDDLILLLLGLQ